MANMGYCRFENTFNDLVDCQEALDNYGAEEIIEGASEYEKPNSHGENKAASNQMSKEEERRIYIQYTY